MVTLIISAGLWCEGHESWLSSTSWSTRSRFLQASLFRGWPLLCRSTHNQGMLDTSPLLQLFWKLHFKQLFCSVVKQYFEKMLDVHVPKWLWHNIQIFLFLHRGVRPFGVSLLIAGWDEDRPYLFQSDPSVCYSLWCYNYIYCITAIQFKLK